MKRFLAALVLLNSVAHGAAYDVAVEQRNATNNGWITRLMVSPPVNGLMIYDTVTLLPKWVTPGSGLTLSATTLDAAPQAWGTITGKPTFATVATSGAYADLTGKPTIPAAQVNTDWQATSGPAEMLNKPTTVAASGITDAATTAHLALKFNTPTGTTAQYLRGDGTVATFPTQVQPDWNATLAPAAILNKPLLFSGAYADLTGVPSTFAPAAHTHAAADIVSGTLALARLPSLPISQTTGLQTALDGKYPLPTGNTSQYLRGDGSVAAFPSIPAAQVNADWNAVSGVAQILNKPTLNSGTVTGVTAGTGLSGGTITTTGTISLPNVGTAGTYSGVTTDAQGRVTAGTNRSINDTPGRALVTTTASTGFQVSATRMAQVCYEGSFSTTSTIGGPSSASVFLETADTNSTTPSDWTTKAQQTYSNNITLAIVLNQVQGNNWSMCRYIPAGKFVRIRSGSVTGTASATINATQQETLL